LGQQGTLTHIWAKRGTRPRAPRDQRYEWAYLFGPACPGQSVTAALVLPKANAEAMNLPLEEISRKVAAGAHAALILDGAGYHHKAALEVPENITLVPLPAYSPELNPVENIWEYLRGNKLANTFFETYDEIVDKTCQAWMFFANDKHRVASITSCDWATVIALGRWHYSAVRG
jgi:transposase